MNWKCMQDGGTIDRKEVAAFFDELAPGWEQDLVVDTPKINAILDAAGILPRVRVLDVACGTGGTFSLLPATAGQGGTGGGYFLRDGQDR